MGRNKVEIKADESGKADGYSISVTCGNGEGVTVAKCWDAHLAEALKKTVEDYIGCMKG